MYCQSNELVKSIKAAWRNLEALEQKAIRSFGEDAPVIENIGYACTYLMNADIEMEDYPDKEINQNMLEEATLDQIFDVLNLINGESPESRYDLIDAARRAFKTSEKFYGVHQNTIRDACTRRLQLKISGFYELVENWLKGDFSRIKEILNRHTPEYYHSEIDRFFA